MSLDIYLKPNELSASLLRKAIHTLESAISMTTSAGDEAIAWNDSGNELFTADAQNNLLSARGMLMSALERLETSAAMMTTCSEEISDIDQVYRTDLKEWKSSGDHTRVGWQFCPACVITSGVAEVEQDRPDQETTGGTQEQIDNVADYQAQDEQYPFVLESHDYSNGVQRGTIRYVYQNNDGSGWQTNGWEGFSGSGECGYASQSMALSYLGKDVSPGYLCRGEVVDGLWSTGYGTGFTYGVEGIGVDTRSGVYGGAAAADAVQEMTAKFIADKGKGEVSPVIIHYNNPSTGHIHAIIIVGGAEGNYTALDPAKGNRPIQLTIDENGEVGGEVTYAGGSFLDGVQQYYLR